MIVDFQQVLDGFDLAALGCMIKPAWSNRDIDFRRDPVGAVTMPLGQFLIVGCAGVEAVPLQGGPVGLTAQAVFVTHPANVRSGVTEHHGLGL